MCCISSQKWTPLILIMFIRWANVQMAYPVFMPAPPPIIALPPPMPVPIIAIELQEVTTATTTTTSTESSQRSVAIAFPVPVPMPVQVGVPGFAPGFCVSSPRPKNCPPCPPCLCMPQCTPAFFSYCSPCHQKCRCRNPGDTPSPLPPAASVPIPAPAYPIPVPMIPAPPPVMIVPMPPQIHMPPRRQRRRKPSSQDCSSSSEEGSSDDTSSDCDHMRHGRKFKRRRLKILRRKASSDSENELVQPVLTYVSDNGKVRFKKPISHNDVDRLLGKQDGRRYKTINVMTRNGDLNKQELVVISNDENGDEPQRYKQVLLRNGPSHHLSSGKKELVFKPPSDKRISNLSVSFQIEKR